MCILKEKLVKARENKNSGHFPEKNKTRHLVGSSLSLSPNVAPSSSALAGCTYAGWIECTNGKNAIEKELKLNHFPGRRGKKSSFWWILGQQIKKKKKKDTENTNHFQELIDAQVYTTQE